VIVDIRPAVARRQDGGGETASNEKAQRGHDISGQRT
jgi:hypothetical protein